MRIKVSGELGTVVMSLAVIGLYYGAASFLIENVILRNLTEEERDEHILSKLLFWSRADKNIKELYFGQSVAYDNCCRLFFI